MGEPGSLQLLSVESRTQRSTEWRPGGAAWQFGRQRRAAIGELIVRRRRVHEASIQH